MGSLNLDSSQREFVESESNNIRLLAPAGAGKTASLLYRCKFLTDISKSKPKFLIITFTKIARDELVRRMKSDEFFSDIIANTSITTLNSWGYKKVREKFRFTKLVTDHKGKYLLVRNTLQPVWESYDHISELITGSRFNKFGNVLIDLIDEFKSLGFSHREVGDYEKFLQHWDYIFREVQAGKKLIDFSDNLKDTGLIDRNSDEQDYDQIFQKFVPFWIDCVEKMSSESFFTLEDQKYWAKLLLEDLISKEHNMGGGTIHHVLVDEFQDINPLDLQLVKAIADLNKANLVIVGDDDQAIFEWRGATPYFILSPDNVFKRTFKTYILEKNYRCPKNLVFHSQKLIKFNKNRVDKKVDAANPNIANIELIVTETYMDSVQSIFEMVKKFTDDSNIQSIALIGRKRSQIIPYQIILAGNDIPFFAAEDLQIFLTDAFNNLKELLNKCRNSHTKNYRAVDDLLELCDQYYRFPLKRSEYQELRNYLNRLNIDCLNDAIVALRKYPKPIKNIVDAPVKMADAMISLVEAHSVSDKIEMISYNFDGLKKDYGKSLEDVFYTDPPFYYLSQYAKKYGEDIDAFLKDLQKAANTLAVVPSDEIEDDNNYNDCKINLMTALRAKGKEFDVVLILDTVDNIWPSVFAKNISELEQERRLFYVAVTRAKKKLLLIANNGVNNTINLSPFLFESGIVSEVNER